MTGPEPDTRPLTYAARDDAMAYVARICAAASTAPAAAVYLIANPADREHRSWPDTIRTLNRLLPGVPLATWADVPGARDLARDPAARTAALAGLYRAAVVIPHRIPPKRRLIGRPAQREAEAFAALGRPVLVLTGRRLVAWPDAGARRATPSYPPRWPVELDIPGPPPSPLPTLAASLRALGLDAGSIARASVGQRDRPAPPAARVRGPVFRPPGGPGA
jgi:hypothetical protein